MKYLLLILVATAFVGTASAASRAGLLHGRRVLQVASQLLRRVSRSD